MWWHINQIICSNDPGVMDDVIYVILIMQMMTEYCYLDALCRAKFIPHGLTASGYFN